MSKLFSTHTGEGEPIILIHGFPLNQKIWTNFARLLAEKFSVYTIDLPGFGNSPGLHEPFTIDDVAEEILNWIRHNEIENATLIGHSLGGYVSLALLESSPHLFKSLVLFHSTALPDTSEKKVSRNKVLDFIGNNGVLAFTSNFIPSLFANSEHPAVKTVRSISQEASEDAVKGYTIAMRDRPDRTNVLKQSGKPVLFLCGEKDQGIPVETIKQQAALPLDSTIHIIPDVAHMGMFENENQCVEIISDFIAGKSVTK